MKVEKFLAGLYIIEGGVRGLEDGGRKSKGEKREKKKIGGKHFTVSYQPEVG